MTRTLSSALAFIWLLAPATAQISQVPVRDPNQPVPNMPTERRVPVGTSSVTGTVIATDAGRPVRGARVNLNGSIPTPTSGRATGGGPMAAGPGSATGSLTGVVGGILGGTGRGSASLVMSGASRVAITDAYGRFSFERLPAGRYSVNVNRNGFLSTNYGQKKPGGPGTTFELADSQKVSLNLQLLRGGVITGTVFSEDGDPLPNTQVSAWRFAMQNGVKRLQQTSGSTSDDRGMYRLHGLQPGEYLISSTPYNYDIIQNDRMLAETIAIERAINSGAIQPPAMPGQPATVVIPIAPPPSSPSFPNEGQPPGFLPVYHPSTSVPTEATIVTVAGGDEHPNVDVQVRMVQASIIQGTVTNPPGTGFQVRVSLINDDPMFSSNMGGAMIDSNGRFTFRNVAPGKYTIHAQIAAAPNVTVTNGVPTQPSQPPVLTDEQKMWGRAVVSVEGQPSIGASVTLRPGRTIAGHLAFDMERPPDLLRTKMTVSLMNAPSGPQIPMYGPSPQAEIGADGRFALTAVPPGLYQIRANGGWVRSIMVNGADILDFPLNFTASRDITDVVITMTDKFTELTGTLTDATGKPGVDYSVIAVAEDPRFWTPGSRRVVITRPQQLDGRYAFRNLPPGTYLLAAVTDLEYGAQYDPAFLKSLSLVPSMKVTLIEGVKLSQDLRLGR